MATQALGLLLAVRLFDPATFGQLSAAGTLAVLLGVLPTFGSGFVLMSRSTRNPSVASDVWRYAWPMTLGLGTLLTAAYIPLATAAGGTDALSVNVLIVIAVTELLAMPLISLVSFSLQSLDRVPLSQVLQSSPFIFRVALLLPCFVFDQSFRLQAFVLLQLVATLGALAITLLIARNHFPTGESPRVATSQELRDGALYAGMHLAAANATEIDKVLAIRLIGAHDTGLYAAASRVLVALMMPINAMTISAQPRLFGIASAPTHEGHRLIGRVGALSAAWGLLGAVVLMAGSQLVPFVFGQDYLVTSRIMFWMGFVAPLMAMRFAAGSVILALGRPLDRLTFELAGILTCIVALTALAPSMGALGVVTAVGLSEATMFFMGARMVFKRLAQHDLGDTPLR